jgi:uncharacterized membrane protein YccF (DUF307 family)
VEALAEFPQWISRIQVPRLIQHLTATLIVLVIAVSIAMGVATARAGHLAVLPFAKSVSQDKALADFLLQFKKLLTGGLK